MVLKDFLEGLLSRDAQESISQLSELLKTAKQEDLISYFRSKEKGLDNSTATFLIKIFSKIGDRLNGDPHVFFGFSTPFGQCAIFICQLLQNRINESERFKLTKWTLENAEPFKFSYEIFNFCRDDTIARFYSEPELSELAQVLLKRARYEAGIVPIWEKYITQSTFLLRTWAKEVDKFDLQKYIQENIKKNPQTIYPFLNTFTGYIESSAHPVPYRGAFDTKSFSSLKDIISPRIIANLIVAKLTDEKIDESYEYVDLKGHQTYYNLLNQFMYWVRFDENKELRA